MLDDVSKSAQYISRQKQQPIAACGHIISGKDERGYDVREYKVQNGPDYHQPRIKFCPTNQKDTLMLSFQQRPHILQLLLPARVKRIFLFAIAHVSHE